MNDNQVYTIQQTSKDIKLAQLLGFLLFFGGLFMFLVEPLIACMMVIVGLAVSIGASICKWWCHG
jgi:hypothetical protein